MADIRINQLPEEVAPVSTENVAIDSASTRRVTIQRLVDAGAPVASQAEAEAGTNAVKRMTPLTTAQAIVAQVAPVGLSGDFSDLVGAATGSQIADEAISRIKTIEVFSRTVPLNIQEYGVVGYDNPATPVDESTDIAAAINAALADKRELFIPGNYYQFGGLNFTSASNLKIIGDHISKPILVGTQALADAAGRLIRVNRSAYDVAAGVITVTANITPGQKKITLSSTAQLAVGMMIEIVSNKLWYYDNRGVDTCGELHEIARIVSGTQIEVWDFTRDFYNIATETLTVRAYWGDKMEINNIDLLMPAPATAVSTCCLQTDRLFRPRVNDVTFKGATFCGWLNHRSWQGRHVGIRAQNIGYGASAGYGVSDRASVGSHYDDLRGHSMRRLIDFEGTSGIVNRDGLVKNFEMFGGGTEYDGSEYYPSGAVPSYGVGMHGPCEGARFIDGVIGDVEEGVKIRGRDTEVRGVKFFGKFSSCISATFGTGLIVENNSYERYDYPDKVASGSLDDSAQAQNFLRFGVTAADGAWNWGSPVSVKNNTSNGLKDSFIYFAGSGGTITPSNLGCEGNTVTILRPVATTFEFYKADGSVRIGKSKMGPNKVFNQGSGSVDMYSANITIANTSQVGADGAVEIGDDYYMLTIVDDGYAVLREASKQAGDRVGVLLSDQSGNVYGNFIVLSGTASLVSLGAVAASVVGFAAGSTLNGTTGVDGNFSVGLTSGDLYLENRTGAARRLRIRLL